MVVVAAGKLRQFGDRRAAELAAPDDQGVVQHPTGGEIGQEVRLPLWAETWNVSPRPRKFAVEKPALK